MSDLGPRIAAYLAHRMPAASGVAVDELARIHGGSSQETFRFRARWDEAGRPVERRLVLRRLPVAGTVVVERDLEYTVYSALAGHGLPVPGVHFHEPDPAWLDRPFFVMDLCPGVAPAVYHADPYGAHGAALAREFWTHMGALAALDHRALGLQALRNGGETARFWARELDHWEAIVDSHERGPEPVVRGALRRLRRFPPPEPAKPALVHGDLRSGNFLFTPDGRISAILDWEMAHIGDPLEDVAWALDSFWTMAKFLLEDEGLAAWRRASGLAPDPAALDWWRLFATVKAAAIWITAGASVADGRSHEMVVVGSAVRGGSFHRRAILARLEQLGAMG